MENFKQLFNNALSYSAGSQEMFNRAMAELGYSTMSTFFADLSIAEWFGKDALRKTFDQVLKEWGQNIKMFTEFVMCLNHKSWFWLDTEQFSFDQCSNIELARLYCDLYDEADQFVIDNFSEADQNYYYRTTD